MVASRAVQKSMTAHEEGESTSGIRSQKIKLQPTAAFVMDLASQLYAQDPLMCAYFGELDLTSAFDLVQDYKKADVYALAKELMCNRKDSVRQIVLDAVENQNCSQILSLASGKSPLSLEVLGRRKSSALQVFEVDLSGMKIKEKLYRKLLPEESRQAHFLEMDINSGGLLSALIATGFKTELPSVIILEGITHYLPKQSLETLLRTFSSGGKERNWVVIEFGPPLDSISEAIRPVAVKAYATIEKRFHRGGMTKFTVDELDALLRSVGGKLQRHFPMNEMERSRLGKNRYFPDKNSGWVELVVGKI